MRYITLCAAIVTTGLVLGCGDSSKGDVANEGTEAAIGHVPIAVTRGAPRLPNGCRPAQVARVVVAFFERYNRGDPAAASLFVFTGRPGGGILGNQGPATGPNWYSVTDGDPQEGGRHFVARTSAALMEHVRARHEHGERFRLLEVKVRYQSGGIGHIEYRLTRHANDLRTIGIRTPLMGGKGAIDCRDRRLVSWSMGAPAGQVPGNYVYSIRLCPRPRMRSTSPVACAV
jgi:hypothetical protein